MNEIDRLIEKYVAKGTDGSLLDRWDDPSEDTRQFELRDEIEADLRELKKNVGGWTTGAPLSEVRIQELTCNVCGKKWKFLEEKRMGAVLSCPNCQKDGLWRIRPCAGYFEEDEKTPM